MLELISCGWGSWFITCVAWSDVRQVYRWVKMTMGIEKEVCRGWKKIVKSEISSWWKGGALARWRFKCRWNCAPISAASIPMFGWSERGVRYYRAERSRPSHPIPYLWVLTKACKNQRYDSETLISMWSQPWIIELIAEISRQISTSTRSIIYGRSIPLHIGPVAPQLFFFAPTRFSCATARD